MNFKKYLTLILLLLSTFLSYGQDLLQNGVLGNLKDISPEMKSKLEKYGAKVELAKFPFLWAMSCNDLKIKDSVLTGTITKNNRLQLNFQSQFGDIILYNRRRIKVSALQNKIWSFNLYGYGNGKLEMIFYGYNQAGKCVAFKKLGAAVLSDKKYEYSFVIDKNKFDDNITEVSLGISIRGKITINSLEFIDITADKAKKITDAALKELSEFSVDDPSFRKNDGWVLVAHDGAEGEIKYVANGRDDNRSLELIKTNDKGFLQLVSAKKVKVFGGKSYVFRGYFQADTSTLDSLLLFRVTASPAEKNFRYDDVDRSFGFPAQSLLINAPEKSWNKRVVSFQPKADGEAFLNVLLIGNRAKVKLDDLNLTDDDYVRNAPSDLQKRTKFPYTKEQVYEILKQRGNQEAFLSKKNDHMQMLLNGKAVNPVLYKTEAFYDDYIYNRFTEFGQASVPFAIKTVPLSTARRHHGIVKAEGVYDFAMLDEVVLFALRQNPYVNLVIDFNLNEPYPGWGEKHPDELWRNAKQEIGYGSWGNCEGFVANISEIAEKGKAKGVLTWPFGSYSSPSYRQSHIKSIVDITGYLMKSPLRNAIVGFHIGGGHDAQFQYFRPDFSSCSVRAFQKYLQKKYQTIGGLNSAINGNFSNFSEVPIPEWDKSRVYKVMEHNIISEYKEFQRHESWSLKHEFANAARQAAGKKVFVSAYGLPLEYHAETFCRTPDGVDLFAVPSWYPFRQKGYPIGAKVDGTFALHNKMWVNEMDLRTWTESAKSEVYDMWIGSAVDLPFWQSVNRKFAGVALAHRSAWWYYSMYRYFDRVEVMEEIKATMRSAVEVLNAPENPFRPDVCVIRSESGDDLLTSNFSADANTVIFPIQLMNFEKSGVPYDLYGISDLINYEQLHDYKMYVFLHNGYFSQAALEMIEKLKKKNCQLIFVYNSGYLSENQAPGEAISKITGWKITSDNKFNRSKVFLKSVPGFNFPDGQMLNSGDLLLSMLAVRGISPHYKSYQLFRIENAKPSEIIAVYEDGTTAGAIRDGICYLGAPFGLSSELFYELAGKAGAYRVCKSGQSVFMNGNFISLHGLTGGKWRFQLPPGVNQVKDLFQGINIPVANGIFDFQVKVGESYWFLLTK